MNKESKYYTDPSIKMQIDVLLKDMAIAFANTGKDSTFMEMKAAYKTENSLINEIAKIDLVFSKIIRPYKNE